MAASALPLLHAATSAVPSEDVVVMLLMAASVWLLVAWRRALMRTGQPAEAHQQRA